MEIKKSLWKQGKEDSKKYNKIRLGRKVGLTSFFLGLVLTAIMVIPLACITFEVVELYWYNSRTMVIFLAIAWGLIMLCNGMSNYISVRIAKVMNKDMTNLQEINEFAILFYQSLNLGFGLFIFGVLLFFGVSSLS